MLTEYIRIPRLRMRLESQIHELRRDLRVGSRWPTVGSLGAGADAREVERILRGIEDAGYWVGFRSKDAARG